MLAYLLRRLWQMIPTLLGVVLLVFFLFRKFGVDPAQTLASLNASPREIAEIRQQLGLSEPWWVQLALFVKGIVTFDWGRSWATNETIAHLMATRLPATLTVTIPILILDTLIAIPIALGVAYVRGSLTDRAVMVGTTLAQKNNLTAGSTFTIQDKTFTVAGIFDAGTAFGRPRGGWRSRRCPPRS